VFCLERAVCAGFENGDIKLFDLRRNQVRWEFNVQHGVCCLEFDRKDIEMNKLIATTLEGRFCVFDMRTQHPKHGFASLVQNAHASTVWTARSSPFNRDVWMTTGGDGSLKLWQYNYPSSRKRKDPAELEEGVMGSIACLATLEVATQPILALDWSVDKEGLCVFGALDQSVKMAFVTSMP